MADIQHIDVEEARRRVDAGALLLDVREPSEWTAGHAPTAVHVPMRDVPAHLEGLSPDREIVAVCKVGGRSAAVTGFLVDRGFAAVNLAGGMEAWAAAGLPVVDGDGAPGFVA